MGVTVGIWQSHSVMLRAKHWEVKCWGHGCVLCCPKPLKPVSYFYTGVCRWSGSRVRSAVSWNLTFGAKINLARTKFKHTWYKIEEFRFSGCKESKNTFCLLRYETPWYIFTWILSQFSHERDREEINCKMSAKKNVGLKHSRISLPLNEKIRGL